MKSRKAPMSVTPVGSCRIMTPLKRGIGRYEFSLNRTGVYGYCHSGAEALQMVKSFQNDWTPSSELLPYLTKGRSTPMPHQPSDHYVVELSSAKHISLDNTAVQLNYLVSQHQAFFADPVRARSYWAAIDTNDQDMIDRALAQLCPNGAHKKDQQALRLIRRSFVDRDTLSAQVTEIMDRLPSVQFITHVAARTPDQKLIKSRAEFVTLVRDVVLDAGGNVFDPTPQMDFVGQQRAIADNSDGYAHFTDVFSDLMMDSWAQTTPFNMQAKPKTGGIFEAALLLERDRMACWKKLVAVADTQPKLAAIGMSKLAIKDLNIPIDIAGLATAAPYLSADVGLVIAAQTGRAFATKNVSETTQVRVLRRLFEDGDLARVDDLVQAITAENLTALPYKRTLNPILQKWIDDARKFTSRPQEAAVLALVLRFDQTNSAAKSRLVDIRRVMMENLSKTRDLEGCLALGRLNQSLPIPSPSVDVAICRAHFENQDYALAISAGERVISKVPTNLTLWVTLMRAAENCDHPDLMFFAQNVATLASHKSPKYLAEATRFLSQDKVAV